MISEDTKLTLGVFIGSAAGIFYLASFVFRSEALAEKVNDIQVKTDSVIIKQYEQNEKFIDRLGRIEERLKLIEKGNK